MEVHPELAEALGQREGQGRVLEGGEVEALGAVHVHVLAEPGVRWRRLIVPVLNAPPVTAEGGPVLAEDGVQGFGTARQSRGQGIHARDRDAFSGFQVLEQLFHQTLNP